jgi:hypothetical protein
MKFCPIIIAENPMRVFFFLSIKKVYFLLKRILFQRRVAKEVIFWKRADNGQ